MQTFDSRQIDPRRFNADWSAPDDRRGPHRGRGPAGAGRTDDDISEDLHEALSHDRWLDADDIRLEVSDGDVRLSGSVPEPDDKIRAEIHAQKTRGVRQVRNELHVSSRDGLGPTLGMDVRES